MFWFACTLFVLCLLSVYKLASHSFDSREVSLWCDGLCLLRMSNVIAWRPSLLRFFDMLNTTPRKVSIGRSTASSLLQPATCACCECRCRWPHCCSVWQRQRHSAPCHLHQAASAMVEPRLGLARSNQAQFATNGVSTSLTKYFYVVQALPDQTADRIPALLQSPLAGNHYWVIKDKLSDCRRLCHPPRGHASASVHHFYLMLDGLFLLTDHKQLATHWTGFLPCGQAWQQWLLAFISEFTGDICYLPGAENVAVDAMAWPLQLSCQRLWRWTFAVYGYCQPLRRPYEMLCHSGFGSRSQVLSCMASPGWWSSSSLLHIDGDKPHALAAKFPLAGFWRLAFSLSPWCLWFWLPSHCRPPALWELEFVFMGQEGAKSHLLLLFTTACSIVTFLDLYLYALTCLYTVCTMSYVSK